MKVASRKFSTLRQFLERCFQTFAVSSYMLFLVTGSVFGWLCWLSIIYFCPLLRIPMLLYLAWIYYDRNAGEVGGRRSESLREWSFWRYHKDYFPAKTIKTAEIPPNKNYIFGCFPHGILATGPFCAFGNKFGGCAELFPGIKISILTLAQHFHTPFIREYALKIGAHPSSASCMNRLLGSEEKGHALVLMVGGAQETFYTAPRTYTFNLKNRKGFIKIALKNGASLVPVITFGEPDIYHQLHFKEGSVMHNIQAFFKRVTGIAPVIFYGRFSVTPFRKPLFTVLGEPIDVEKVDEPTAKQLEDLHAKFVEKLNELFEREKHKYMEDSDDVHITIV